MKTESKPLASLYPREIEIGARKNGRPGYKWVRGYMIVTPDGSAVYPYMRKAEALRYCREMGWDAEFCG